MAELDITKSRIYIADDVSANRSLLQAVLSRGGLTNVHVFGGGRSLLAAIDEHEPDLILLDLRMPEMDGYEVLSALGERRSADRFLPVLVLTAESAQGARSTALAAGANDYVTKPFDGGEVLLRVRNLLQTRALHRALEDRNAELAGEVVIARHDLSSREREWAVVSASLSQLEILETAEETAEAICDELRKISGLTSVIIVAVDSAGQAVPLAYDGIGDARITVNRALPKDLTELWATRVGTEAWIGPWEPAFGSLLQRLPVEQPTAMAIIPMRTSKGILGAVAATTAVPDGVTYLRDRLSILNSFGAIAAALLAPGILERQHRGIVRADLLRILEEHEFTPVFQPIVELDGSSPVGFEALTRFRDGVRPDRRFADAAAVGLGIELEAATLKAALVAARELPPDLWVSLNVSPAFLLDAPRLLRALGDKRRTLVLEITEHVAIEDYVAFRSSVAALGTNLRYAVDDAGAGFSSFRHILELRPDFVKLDIGLVRGIDRDDVRQALVAGISYFARRSGCRLIAEGIETSGERAMVQSLGVELGQGFLLGRPKGIGAIGAPLRGDTATKRARAQAPTAGPR